MNVVIVMKVHAPRECRRRQGAVLWIAACTSEVDRLSGAVECAGSRLSYGRNRRLVCDNRKPGIIARRTSKRVAHHAAE